MCDEATCPRCGSADVISYGKTKKGRPRRKCNACGRTFSLTTGTAMFSRKPDGKKTEGGLQEPGLRRLRGRRQRQSPRRGRRNRREIGGLQIHDPRGRRETAAGQLVHSRDRAIRPLPPRGEDGMPRPLLRLGVVQGLDQERGNRRKD